MNGKNGASKALDRLHAFERAYASKDVTALAALLSDAVVLHGDGTILQPETKGKDAVSKVFDDYFQQQSAQHKTIMEASSGATAFSFWQDEDTEGGVVGVWELAVDDSGLVGEVWLLRQLTHQEEQKLGFTPVKKASVLDSGAQSSPGTGFDEQQLATVMEICKKYNKMWMEKQVQLAEEAVTAGYVSLDLITGRTIDGREAVVKMIQQMPDAWEYQSGGLDVAVVPGTNKAFGRWYCTGCMGGQGSPMSMWGLGFLTFHPDTLQVDRDFSSMLGWKHMEDRTRECEAKHG